MLSPAVVSVDTDATELYTADGGSAVVTVQPTGAVCFVGGSTVTATTGISVADGATFTTTLEAGEALYGIVASSTVNVRVLVQGA